MMFRTSYRWFLLLLLESKAEETVAVTLIPKSIHPRTPVISYEHPKGDHESNQKEVRFPFPTFILRNCFARSLYFSSFRHIHDPAVVVSLIDQIVSLLTKYVWIHLAQSEGWEDRSLHNSFRMRTLFIAFSGLKPKPPSLFGRQTTSQEIFAFFTLREGPDQRNTEQRLLVSLIHYPGSLKPVIQKFNMLIITAFINCSEATINIKRLVHKLIRFFIFSIST